eukprot:TRINITY_DN72648_c0_g1_i1.p1 TRINITY_DN72648_c0_g1~~TRINITY_DN72648_c0_g1_i1.p1  ORF type:complete len:437 (-),score=106.42 TRINITY_DN72648_c0_g1_i1:134-1444(-)
MAANGQELRGMVDEQDEENPPPKKKDEGIDWDSVCAYQTNKMVRIRDWKLGGLYWSVLTIILMYIIIVIFIIEGRQKESGSGQGTVLVRFRGKGFANGRVFDEADLRFPPIEPAGAFIMTKRTVIKGQKRGRCVDEDFPRQCPCRGGGVCRDDGLCEVDGTWCPSLGEHNMGGANSSSSSPPEGAIVERLEGLEHGLFQIMTSITFPGLDNAMYFATDAPGGDARLYKNITVKDLLGLIEPPLSWDEVVDKGVLISIAISWNCDVTMEFCEPFWVASAVDGGAGYVQKQAKHYRANGEEVRDAIYMNGLRIIVDSQGVGRRTTAVLIVLQIGSGIGLLKLAAMFADFIMLKMYDADRRKAYYKCKVEETRDYSDLQDRINLVKDHQQEPASLLGKQSTRRGGAGTSVPLGIGGGARGGLASSILRGRNTASSSSAS